MRRPTLLTASALVLALAGSGAARAQSLEDRLRAQLVAVTNQLRAAQAAQTGQASLSAEKDAAEKERDALKAKLAAAEAKLRTAKRTPAPPTVSPDLDRYKALADQSAQADAQDKAALATAQAETERLNGELEQLRSEHDRITATLTSDEQSLTACKSKNAQAIKVAKDILAAYDKVGVVGALTRKEPFTGLKRVQIEQLEQDFGDRIYDSRLDVHPRAAAAPATTDKKSQSK
ncbi:MAG: hypothetical protein WA840_02840 [Caulobacteraceae bacterium]